MEKDYKIDFLTEIQLLISKMEKERRSKRIKQGIKNAKNKKAK